MNILDFLESTDKIATLVINGFYTSFSDSMWRFFSNQEVWYLLYLVIAIFLFKNLGWKKACAVVLSIVITIVICDQMGNLCKNHFERLRPCWDPTMTGAGLRILEDRGGLYGFYSAHAANSAGFAICSSIGFKNDPKRNYITYSRLMTCWFILIGISRIFVGKHFLGDVLTGFAVGILVGYLLGRLTSILLNRSRLFLDQSRQESQTDPTR